MRPTLARRPRAIAAAAAAVLLASCATAPRAQVRTIEIGIRYSKFSPSVVEVARGQTIRFELRNDDPIAHEFIIGTHAEQLAHERGTDRTHDGAHGAASLEPGERQTVVYTFARAGTFEFACHLPGHYRYGMVGLARVR